MLDKRRPPRGLAPEGSPISPRSWRAASSRWSRWMDSRRWRIARSTPPSAKAIRASSKCARARSPPSWDSIRTRWTPATRSSRASSAGGDSVTPCTTGSGSTQQGSHQRQHRRVAQLRSPSSRRRSSRRQQLGVEGLVGADAGDAGRRAAPATRTGTTTK